MGTQLFLKVFCYYLDGTLQVPSWWILNQAPCCHGLPPSSLTLVQGEPFCPPILTCVVSQLKAETLTQPLAQQLCAGKRAETPGGGLPAIQPQEIRVLASCHTTLVSLTGALEMCGVQPGWCLDLELGECIIGYKRGSWNTKLVKCV